MKLYGGTDYGSVMVAAYEKGLNKETKVREEVPLIGLEVYAVSVLFLHIHFAYPNKGRSHCVRISEGLL